MQYNEEEERVVPGLRAADSCSVTASTRQRVNPYDVNLAGGVSHTAFKLGYMHRVSRGFFTPSSPAPVLGTALFHSSAPFWLTESTRREVTRVVVLRSYIRSVRPDRGNC